MMKKKIFVPELRANCFRSILCWQCEGLNSSAGDLEKGDMKRRITSENAFNEPMGSTPIVMRDGEFKSLPASTQHAHLLTAKCGPGWPDGEQGLTLNMLKMKRFLQHHLNPLHIYCTLCKGGLKKDIALKVSRFYERWLFVESGLYIKL